MAERNEIGNAEPRNRIVRQIAERRWRRDPESEGKMTHFSPIDCPFCRFYRHSRLAMDVCRLPFSRRLRCPVPLTPERPRWSGREPMTAPGTWSSRPGRAIAVRPTASLSPYRVRTGFLGGRRQGHRRHQPGRRRGGQYPGRRCRMPAAAGGWSAIRERAAGAASSPATAAAAAGRRREADIFRRRHANGPPDVRGRRSNSRTKSETSDR